MSGRASSYVVKHLELDGAIIDRDEGYPDVRFELHPVGTALAVVDQHQELVIVIESSSEHPRATERTTRLDGEALAALREWLEENK